VGRLAEMAEGNVEMEFTALFKLCLQDPDPQVREQAIGGLWECAERSLITPLITLLQCDPAPQVRAAAAQALGRFTTLAEEQKLLAKDCQRLQESLLLAFHDPGQPLEVRRRALEALAPLSQPEVKELIQQAYRSPEAPLRLSAVYAIGRHGDPQWLPTLLKELESDDPAMRYEAATACGQMGNELAAPHLLAILGDDDPHVRDATIHALGTLGGPLAKKALLNCLKSSDEGVRQAAQVALEVLEAEEDPLNFNRRL
jgi:HEAT repeat protein